MIRYTCPSCGLQKECADALAGLTIICPKCQARIEAPRPQREDGPLAPRVRATTAPPQALPSVEEMPSGPGPTPVFVPNSPGRRPVFLATIVAVFLAIPGAGYLYYRDIGSSTLGKARGDRDAGAKTSRPGDDTPEGKAKKKLAALPLILKWYRATFLKDLATGETLRLTEKENADDRIFLVVEVALSRDLIGPRLLQGEELNRYNMKHNSAHVEVWRIRVNAPDFRILLPQGKPIRAEATSLWLPEGLEEGDRQILFSHFEHKGIEQESAREPLARYQGAVLFVVPKSETPAENMKLQFRTCPSVALGNQES